MKNLDNKSILSIAVIALAAIMVLSGCTQEIQAAVLDKDQYRLEGEKIIVSLSDVSELSEVGGWINIESEVPAEDLSEDLHRSIIVVCTGECQYTVASCSNHKGWTLTYDHEKGLFKSSDGKRKFNMDGSVVGDKPKKPLKIFQHTLEEESLIINISD